MKKFLIAAVICLFAATAFAASPLDVFKGQKGKIDMRAAPRIFRS